MLRLICGFTPQSRSRLVEKLSFHDEWKCELGMHSAGDLVMCLSDNMDTLEVLLMDSMEFMECLVSVRGILTDECYWRFDCRRNYVCQIHD